MGAVYKSKSASLLFELTLVGSYFFTFTESYNCHYKWLANRKASWSKMTNISVPQGKQSYSEDAVSLFWQRRIWSSDIMFVLTHFRKINHLIAHLMSAISPRSNGLKSLDCQYTFNFVYCKLQTKKLHEDTYAKYSCLRRHRAVEGLIIDGNFVPFNAMLTTPKSAVWINV